MLAFWEHPSDVVFFVGFVAYVVIRGVFEQRAKGQAKILRRVDARELVCLGFTFLGCLLLPLLHLFTPWLAFAAYRLPAVCSWFGTAAMLGGLWLFWRAHADLGPNWSVTLEVREGHELVKRGLYRRIRHPMYAGILLVSLGQGLLLTNWLAGWGALAGFGLLYVVRTPREERMMSEFFGEEYRAYMRATGRLFPRWRS